MIGVIYTLILLFGFSFPMTLDEMVKLAEKKATSVKLSELDLKKIEYQIKEVRSNLFPKVLINGSYSRVDKNLNTGFTLENQYRASITVIQKIFDKTVFESLEYAKQNIKLQEAIEKDIKLKVIDTAKRLYYNALLKREIMKRKKETLKFWEENLKLTQEKFKLGLTDKFNLVRTKAQYNLALSDYKESITDYRKSLIDIEKFLLLDSTPEIEGKFSKLKYKDITFNDIKEKNTEIQVIKEKINLAQKQINVTKSTNYPTLEIQADYKTFNVIKFPELRETWRKGYTVSLNFNFILYDGNQKKSKVMQSKIEKMKENINLKDKIKEIESKYEKSLEDLKSLEDRLKALKENLKAAEEALKLSEERYRYGLTGIIEVLDAQRNFENAEIQYLIAVHNYNMKILDLNLLAGNL